jgi:hypothetical protein
MEREGEKGRAREREGERGGESKIYFANEMILAPNGLRKTNQIITFTVPK